MDEEQEADLTFLDSLTGEPIDSDILLHVIPVCAPWNALSRFKYKVKLTPGSLKKGKAGQTTGTLQLKFRTSKKHFYQCVYPINLIWF